jgi:D-beta-D-heptose 7-phosphate kinase/D-beta-D-heptose 1-phosphate adenosyltransferase
MSSAADLIKLVNDLGRPRIAVVGDLMLDEYVWGDVERISPEAPIPVLRVSRRQFRAGGAGSVVADVARLGGEVKVFSLLGKDAAGARVRQFLAQEGCDIEGLLEDEARRTTVKTRLLGFVQQAHRAVQQILRADEEDLTPISKDVAGKLIERIGARAAELDAILISDYNKGLVTAELVQGILRAAPGVPVLVDPARIEDYSIYRGVSLICPNRFEAERSSGISCRDLASCPEAGARLLARHALGAVAITLDRDGIFLCEPARARHFPTQARVVADVSGAGDMVLSVLGLVIAAGGSLDRAVELANVAAGIEIRHIGVTPISRDELLQELKYRGHPVVSKIKTLDELREIVQAASAAGKTVVFTNGCFDLLHLGHHHLLGGAKREGDLLIVAVNSDASIRSLKGPGRPQMREEHRVMMLAALEFVDHVIVFDEDTPNRLLEALRPHVLVKGSEYQQGVVVGREIVEGYGGRVAFVEQIPGISTTALLGGQAQLAMESPGRYGA